MGPYIKSFRMAFSSLSSVLGMVAASLSLISLLVRLLSLDVSQIFERVVKAYRDVAHSVVTFLFGWMAIKLEPWHKDLICLWLILGGVTFRTLLHIFLERKGSKSYVAIVHNDIIAWLVEERWRHFLLAPLCLVGWPLIVARLFWEPIALEPHDARANQVVVFSDFHMIGYTFLYDVRIVFLFQLVAMACAVAAFLVTNGLLNV